MHRNRFLSKAHAEFKPGFFSILFLFALALPVLGIAEEKVLNWKKVKDRNGIQVYRAHSEESKFKTFKAVTRLEVENIGSLVGLFLDEKAYVKWLHMVSGAELLPTEDPRRYELYIETRLPWPVKDRFTRADTVISQREDYSVRVDLLLPEVPAEERKGYILAPVSKGFYELKTVPDSKEVEVTVEILVDPGGYVPAFLVNLITDDMSYYTMKKLRGVIQDSKYQSYSSRAFFGHHMVR